MSDRSPASPGDVLATLPTFDLPPGLWLRIERARRRPERTRRLIALAAAAGIGAFALSIWQAVAPTRAPGMNPTAPLIAVDSGGDTGASKAEPSAGTFDLTSIIERSNALERTLTQVRESGVVMQVALESELARIDAHLQRAYDRAAPASELAQLWTERADTLETLLAAYRHPAALRI